MTFFLGFAEYDAVRKLFLATSREQLNHDIFLWLRSFAPPEWLDGPQMAGVSPLLALLAMLTELTDRPPARVFTAPVGLSDLTTLSAFAANTTIVLAADGANDEYRVYVPAALAGMGLELYKDDADPQLDASKDIRDLRDGAHDKYPGYVEL